MPRAVSRWQPDRRRIVRGQRAFRYVESIDEDLVESQIGGEHESPRRVALDHVRVGPIVAADAKLPGGALDARAGPVAPWWRLTSDAAPRRPSG